MQNLIMTIIDVISPCHQGPQQPQHYCKQRPTRVPSWQPLPQAPIPSSRCRGSGRRGRFFFAHWCNLPLQSSVGSFGKILIRQVLTDVPAARGRERSGLYLLTCRFRKFSTQFKLETVDPISFHVFLKRHPDSLPNRKGHLSSLLPSTELRSP